MMQNFHFRYESWRLLMVNGNKWAVTAITDWINTQVLEWTCEHSVILVSRRVQVLLKLTVSKTKQRDINNNKLVKTLWNQYFEYFQHGPSFWEDFKIDRPFDVSPHSFVTAFRIESGFSDERWMMHRQIVATYSYFVLPIKELFFTYSYFVLSIEELIFMHFLPYCLSVKSSSLIPATLQRVNYIYAENAVGVYLLNYAVQEELTKCQWSSAKSAKYEYYLTFFMDYKWYFYKIRKPQGGVSCWSQNVENWLDDCFMTYALVLWEGYINTLHFQQVQAVSLLCAGSKHLEV